MLLVVAPTRRELGGLALNGTGHSLVAVTGLGRDLTLAYLQALLQQEHPAAIVSLGFAGGLDPALRSADLLLATTVEAVNADGTSESGEELTPDGALLERASLFAEQSGIPYRLGGVAAVSVPLLTAESKGRVRRHSDALVADMEGYWVATQAQAAKLPFLLARVVLDPAGMGLPSLVQDIVADKGRRELYHTARFIVTRPWRTAQVARLAWSAWRAQRKLKRATQEIIQPLGEHLHRAEP